MTNTGCHPNCQGACSECYIPARCLECSGPIPADEDSARPPGNDFCCHECRDEFVAAAEREVA